VLGIGVDVADRPAANASDNETAIRRATVARWRQAMAGGGRRPAAKLSARGANDAPPFMRSSRLSCVVALTELESLLILVFTGL
jgi:hypothetical protein